MARAVSRRASLVGRVHLRALRLVDRLDLFAVPAATFAVTMVVATILVVAGLAQPSSFASAIGAAVVGAAGAYVSARLVRANRVLAEITLSYIATGDPELLDELLGRLIAGDFSRRELRPSDQLFRTLDDVASEGDYELRRRLVEALPGLVELDRNRSIELLCRLREDWDDQWKGDIRRRAVEALVVPSRVSGARIIDVVADHLVEDLLSLRDDDEIWTVFAVIEVAESFAQVRMAAGDWARADAVTGTLDTDLTRLLVAAAERDSLNAYREAVHTLVVDGPSACTDKLRALADSDDRTGRIGAARLISMIAAHPKGTTVANTVVTVAETLSQDGDRYVRRPIARELCVDFLLHQLSGSQAETARRVLFDRLLRDTDAIIPLTTFDLLSAGRLSAEDLLHAADVVAESHEPEALVVRRAERAVAALRSDQQ